MKLDQRIYESRLTMHEAAEHSGIPLSKLYYHLKSGKLPYFSQYMVKYVLLKDLVEFVATNKKSKK